MEQQRTNKAGNIHRQYDDWDEVHNQLLTIQKKSFGETEASDASEKEADNVAAKVVSGPEATTSGSGGSGSEFDSESLTRILLGDTLELPEGDRIVSVQIRNDLNKDIVFTENFLGPYYPTTYRATVPPGSPPGNYTFIVNTMKSGVKNETLYHSGGFFGTTYLDISVKKPDPIKVQTDELKKFDLKSDPQNDASLISDEKIKGTAVYTDLYAQSTAKLPADKEKEAILATRLMLRDVQDPTLGSVQKGKDYLTQAKKQLGVKTTMETKFVVGGNGKEGSFIWNPENSINSTHFSLWVNGTGPEPSTSAVKGSKSVNNCWGVIYYGAYLAGYAPKSWIKDMYAQTVIRQNQVAGDAAKITTIEDWISGGKYYDYDEKTKRPLAGDLVVWGTAYNHIVIATGKADATDGSPEVISLWTIPNNNFLQYTSIKKLSDVSAKGKIKFFSPIWN